MGMSLYSINEAIYAALDDGCIFDEETGEIIFDADSLDELEAMHNDKLEAVALYVKGLEAEAAAIKAEEKTLAERRGIKERKAARLRRYIAESMQAVGSTKLETSRVSLGFRRSEVVEIIDAAQLPAGFVKVKTTEQPDKVAIKKALKAGEAVAGAVLVECQNLQLK